MATADVVIVGAGLAGMACAEQLTAAGLAVVLYDKGRGPGGRMSSRRSDVGRFDHGLPYHEPSTPDFRKWIEAQVEAGHLGAWHPTLLGADTPSVCYVGVPGANAPLKAMAERLGVAFSTRISPLLPPVTAQSGHLLLTETGDPLMSARWVVFGTPAEQTAELLTAIDTPVARAAAKVRSDPAFSMMLGFERPPLACDIAFPQSSPIARIVREDTKPGREGNLARYTVEASADWAARHLEDAPETVSHALLSAFASVAEEDVAPRFQQLHRWRYARPQTPRGGDKFAPMIDENHKIAACGDWLSTGDAAGAHASGTALGQALAKLIATR